jgi:hypothetical protein
MASVHHRKDGAVFAQVLDGSAPAPVHVEVFSVDGRLVDSSERSSAAGSVLAWNPAAAAPGLYFVRARSGARVAQQRVLLLP